MHSSSIQSRPPVSRLALSLTCLVLVALTACTKAPDAAPQVAAPAATTTVGTEIDDSVITTKVKAALLSDADVKSLDIQTETRKGEVQLSGFVDNEPQIERALAAARAVEGVKSVSNMMSVKK
jgi:hyperosmotically inducible protein